MLFKDIPILDPLLSIGITFYILYHVIKNLKDTLGILLDKAPKGIDTNILEEKILGISSIEGLHHLHFWSIDGKEHAFSVHLEVPNDMDRDSIVTIKNKIREHLNEFKVAHFTIQFDYSGENCEQKE